MHEKTITKYLKAYLHCVWKNVKTLCSNFGNLKTELCKKLENGVEWWGITRYPLLMAIQDDKSQVDEPGHVWSESNRLLCWRSNLKFLFCLKTCLHHAWIHAEIIFLHIVTPYVMTFLSFTWIHVYKKSENCLF